MTTRLRALCTLIAVCAALALSVAYAAGPGDLLLPVPQRSQIDGTIWGPSDCGPASLAMVLEAFGDKAVTVDLRKRANELLGVSSPDSGTKIEHLAKIAQEHGLSVVGPMDGKEYRKWTLDQARAEIRAGHPLVAQVYFPYLPNQKKNPVVTDHFIVLVGTDGQDFIYNDPADYKAPGYRQRMTETEIKKAWGYSGAPFAAFSAAPGTSGKSLLPPTPTPVPTQMPAPAPVQPEITPTPMPTAEPQLVEPAGESLPRQATGGVTEESDNAPDQAPAALPVSMLSVSAVVGFIVLIAPLQLLRRRIRVSKRDSGVTETA